MLAAFMVDRLPTVKVRAVIRALLRAGFYVHHQTGSHMRLIYRLNTKRKITVPVHAGDLPRSLLKSILKQAKLSLKEFEHYL